MAPDDPAELELVKRAITSGLRNCCVWDEKGSSNFRSPSRVDYLTPEWVHGELIRYVKCGGAVIQVREKRPEYSDRSFYYKVVLQVEGLPRGLFVEVVLDDEDKDYPAVRIVSAHEQPS